MFITSKKHNSIIKELKNGISALEFKLELQSISHQNLIALYERQILDLKALIFPQMRSLEIDKMSAEVDAVLSASEKSPDMSEAERTKILEGQRELEKNQREVDLIFAGNYDTDLIN